LAREMAARPYLMGTATSIASAMRNRDFRQADLISF